MGSKSLKEYLKKYGSNDQEDEKKVKKKKKKVKPIASGVLVVDEDPVWQKPVKIEEEENDSADEDKPQVDEDIEVKRMKRLELIRARRTYNAIAEDGSGWVILSPKHPNSGDPYSDMSPHYKRNVRNDTPSPEHEGKVLNCGGDDANLSPPRQKQRQHHSPSPVPVTNLNSDLSPPRKRRYRNDTPSPEPQLKPSREASDLSPPQRQRKYHHSPSPKPDTKSKNSSGLNPDLSPPRRQRADAESPKLKPLKEDTDLSPPRQKWRRHYTPPKPEPDLSPPRKRKKDVGRSGLPDNSHLSPRLSTQSGNSRASMAQDISPPRKNRKESYDPVSSKELPKTGLITGRDMREEIKTKKEASLLLEMDPSISGRGAEPVYRDKKTGERISKDDYLKSKHKVEEKPKEKKLEWGKGLAQKREAETRLEDLELEKDKPFARTRDDPELDKMLKERLRWGDPMAHLVKKKHSEPVLADLGDSEKMKESGFVIPQDIPSHSWIKRGLEAAPNRYGIRPGRHWDGVDRSNGNEKELFKRMNEKQATEREAYLWSVSDM